MEEKEKEKKEKTPAHISQHEDTALKATAQFFQEEIMPVLNIEGTVVSVLPTEGIHLELRKGFEDFNYLMSDDTIKHFEFQSTNEGKAELKRKIEMKEALTKADLLPLVLCPLMGGAMSQKERISAAYDITRNATGTDAEVIRKVEALVYVMADKFLEKAEMEQLKKEIKMTALGKMLYDEGKAEGKAKVFVLIQKMTADGELESIPRLTTDFDFYETMLRKYDLEE